MVIFHPHRQPGRLCSIYQRRAPFVRLILPLWIIVLETVPFVHLILDIPDLTISDRPEACSICGNICEAAKRKTGGQEFSFWSSSFYVTWCHFGLFNNCCSFLRCSDRERGTIKKSPNTIDKWVRKFFHCHRHQAKIFLAPARPFRDGRQRNNALNKFIFTYHIDNFYSINIISSVWKKKSPSKFFQPSSRSRSIRKNMDEK